jgi:hypothetical protein
MKKENIATAVLAVLILGSFVVTILGTVLRPDPKEEQVVEWIPGEPVHLPEREYEIWSKGWISPEIRIENSEGDEIEFEEGGYYPGNSKYLFVGSFKIEYEGDYSIRTEGPAAEMYITHKLPRYPFTLFCWGATASIFLGLLFIVFVSINYIVNRRSRKKY